MPGRWRAWYRRAEELHREFFVAPWRAGLQREATRQQDLLMAMAFLEALGIENPAGYTTLELYPEFIARFHEWHRRMGEDTFGDAGVCC